MSSAMNEDEWDEWETDEETDVVVKLSGVIRDDFVKNLSTCNQPKCSALGLLTEEPLLQIGSDLFKGSYTHPLGTHLLLKESRDVDCSDSTGGELTFLTTTDKELEMNKLYVQEKLHSDKKSSGVSESTCTATPLADMEVTEEDNSTSAVEETAERNGIGKTC